MVEVPRAITIGKSGLLQNPFLGFLSRFRQTPRVILPLLLGDAPAAGFSNSLKRASISRHG